MSNQPANTEVLLEARGVSKSFPGVQALDRVDLAVRRGRLNAVVGENGAGKSTLMNILAGVFPPDSGEVLVRGQPVRFRNPREAQRAGIAIIFQELNLVPDLTVAENIFLGREPRNRFGLLELARMNAEAGVWLRELELDVDPRTPVSRLRVGAQQVVEIAKALAFNSQVLILDEPTSAITKQEVEVLVRLVRRLKERGVGLIYITHKLDELPPIADDLTVLRDGRLVGARPFAATTRDEIIRMMVGRELAELYPRTECLAGAELLSVKGLSLMRPRSRELALQDVSFTIRRGEVVGLFGLMGAGRTELLQTLYGLYPHSSTGEIRLEDQLVSIRSPRDAIEAGLALAPEDRKAEGLVLALSVTENATLASLETTQRCGFLQPARERRLAESWVERLGIKLASLDAPVRNLSGGNQQKVVLAKWLATAPQVLLLDEPTRGIDINAKKQIYGLIDELAHDGLGILLVSSELPEILAIPDRILVLAEGRLTAEFVRGEATEEAVLRAALLGGKPER